MTSVSSSTSASAYDSVSTPPATSSSPIAPGASLGQAQSAAALSTDEGVIAILGGGAAAGGTYSAAGLLNAFVNAGTQASLDAPVDTSTESQSQDQSWLGSLSDAGSSAVGFMTTQTGMSSTDLNAQWASVLKTNPGMTADVLADSAAQGILSTLSAFA